VELIATHLEIADVELISAPQVADVELIAHLKSRTWSS